MAKKKEIEKEVPVEVVADIEEPKVETPEPKKEASETPEPEVTADVVVEAPESEPVIEEQEPKVETPKPAKADKCECGGEANEIRNRKGKYIICLDCGLAK
jgi:hypothetical protein